MNKGDVKINEKEVRDYYKLVRKIIKSKTLSERESSHLAVLFMDVSFSILPKKSSLTDELYNKLLDLMIKVYPSEVEGKTMNKNKFVTTFCEECGKKMSDPFIDLKFEGKTSGFCSDKCWRKSMKDKGEKIIE